MATERVQKLIEALLLESEAAIRAGDWISVERLTGSVLALEPANADALAYRDAAARQQRSSPVLAPVGTGFSEWVQALQGYYYPVDLRTFQSPRPGSFDFTIQGDRASTMDFEARFRAKASTSLDVWYEVLYWKFYSDPRFRSAHVERARTRIEASGVTADSLWAPCKQVHANLEADPPAAREALRQLNAYFFSGTGIAAAWTFVAFAYPVDTPMIDSWVADWVFDAPHELLRTDCGDHLARPSRRFRGPSGHRTLALSHFETFVLGWIRWTRCLAKKLTAESGQHWRARDVEMAVYRAADKRKAPINLPPL
jgi:hypothetical protein